MQDDRKKRGQIVGVVGGVLSLIFAVNLAIGLATPPKPKPKATPSPVPSPIAVATPSPKPPIPPAMLALGEKTAKKTQADVTVWGGISGRYAMTLLPRESWEALSKTEKAALTYYAEASIAQYPGICGDCWTVTVSNSAIRPYGIDESVVGGYGGDMDSNAVKADKFRADMLRQ